MTHAPDADASRGIRSAPPSGAQPLAEPEILPPGLPPEQEARLRRVQALADWLDTRFEIPVIRYPIGLDGLLGLIPGVGDTISGALSAYLVAEAYRAGCRKRVIGKMCVNAGVDWAVGLIPLVGDLLDIANKANSRNARLLLDEIRRGEARSPRG